MNHKQGGFTFLNIFRTKQQEKSLDNESIIAALNKVQAIVEFDLAGNITNANELFLSIVGYKSSEVIGHHHSMFVKEELKNSIEYTEFWETLRKGQEIKGVFRRLEKRGEELWIFGSYTPIKDAEGNTYKILKFASDITQQKMKEKENEDALAEEEQKTEELLNSLQNRIQGYCQIIAAIAQGDLTKKVTANEDDDLGRLGQYINHMSSDLKSINQKIVSMSTEIVKGIDILEEAATEQAAAASQQATSVSEISTVIEEIQATSQHTLERATNLGEESEKTISEGEKGRDAIYVMSKSMKELQQKIKQIAETILKLSDKTQMIGEITETVSDIAKQSKMLALNASIEAAKAGETGKGFAVVASEVKELADKSQDSTERVKKILQDIRDGAEHAVMVTESGTKSLDENLEKMDACGVIMDQISVVIQNTANSYSEIVTAVREESTGIKQIIDSIKEIDDSTGQFTKSTEQTKHAVSNLSVIAEALKETANTYQLDDEE